jgi:ATP-dependent DNA helicase
MSAAGNDSPTDSRAGTTQPESTVPSSPVTSAETNDVAAEMKEISDSEEVDEMDSKAKALMHLLKTSSVRTQLHQSLAVTSV